MAARSSPNTGAHHDDEPSACVLIEKMASEAAVREKLQQAGEGKLGLAADEDVDAGEYKADAEVVGETEPVPEEKDQPPANQQPKTLQDILQAALAKDTAGVFKLAEPSGQGDLAVLDRIALLIGPVRHFVRFVRLEEGLLSLAWIEGSRCDLNQWNKAEHELSLARLVQNCSKTRLARATLWSNITDKLCSSVASHNAKASAEDSGLRPPSAFRPPVDMKVFSFQVLLIKGAALKAGGQSKKVLVCCVLAAFRGSLMKTKSGNSTVRAGKPSPAALPAGSTRVLHACELLPGDEPGRFSTSAAAPPLVFDPTNCVLGELTVESVLRSGRRLHIALSAAALRAVNHLASSKTSLPEMPPGDAEEMEGSDGPVADPSQPKQCTFNESSFTKTTLRAKVKEFLEGVKTAFAELKIPMTNAEGKVEISSTLSVAWTDLCDRTATYLNKSSQAASLSHRSVCA